VQQHYLGVVSKSISYVLHITVKIKNKLNLLSKAIYVSEQVCIGWCRTGAYYTAKLTFSHDFPIQIWGAYYTNVHIVFEILQKSVNICRHCSNMNEGLFCESPCSTSEHYLNDKLRYTFLSDIASSYSVSSLSRFSIVPCITCTHVIIIIIIQILLFSHPCTLLYLSISWLQNCQYYCHIYRSLQTWLLQFTILQSTKFLNKSTSTNPKLYCSHCCQISKVPTHHSCNQVSALFKGQGTHWVQASLSHYHWSSPVKHTDSGPASVYVNIPTSKLFMRNHQNIQVATLFCYTCTVSQKVRKNCITRRSSSSSRICRFLYLFLSV